MDTNQNGVSLDDVAAMIDPEDEDLQDTESENEDLPEEADEGDSESESEDSDEVTDTESESEEIEFEGKQYKVPKELKGAFLRQADYTQKTQEVAAQRRQVEEFARDVQTQQRIISQSFDAAVELRGLQKQLEQFDSLDWRSIADADPVEASKISLAYQQLQRKIVVKQQELQQAQVMSEQLTAQQRQQKLANAQTELKQRLPDFSEKVAVKIRGAAKDYGITDEEIGFIDDPRYVHILHDAMKWRELQTGKPKALKKVAEAPTAVKQKPAQVKNEQRSRELKAKFASGRATLKDLASYID